MVEPQLITLWLSGAVLVSLRLGAALIATPLFGLLRVPALARAGLLCGLTLALVPLVPTPGLTSAPFVLAAVGEVLLGLTLALGVRCVFMATELAGRMIEAQAGLSMAAFFNPATRQRDSVLGTALSLAALVLLFQLNAHHALLRALAYSFELAPVGGGWHASLDTLLRHFGRTWLVGSLMGGSVVLALWLVDLMLATMVRSMPQFNVLFLAFPLKLLLALVMTALLAPRLAPALAGLAAGLNDYFAEVLRPYG